MDIPVVWSPQTRRHDPRHEIWVGKETQGTEVPERVDAILAALADLPTVEAVAHDDVALEAVHSPELLAFLRTIAADWSEGPYEQLVGQDRVVPYFFETPALVGQMTPRAPVATHARVGWHCYDTMTTIGPGTWEAARAGVDCALTAVDHVAAHGGSAYALCRPPGHHATRSGYGGSCYLNNAAVAAEALRKVGHERVAILDLDAHHGNGTQEIFWERPDVLYASLHVDPGAGWFPHVFGYADETGAGLGVGATRNLPLAEGTADPEWIDTVADLTDWIGTAEVGAVVISLGVDAAADDPESPLLVTKAGYGAAGKLVASLGVPVVAVQEGGYHLPSLGGLVRAFLSGLADS